MYKFFLCKRYLLHRRVVIVPILAVMLCVAMNVIVVSLMGGFLDKLRGSVRGLFGDVIIGNGSLAGFGYYDEYQDAEGNTHPGLLQYLEAISEGRPTSQPASAPPQLAELYAKPAVIRQATAVIETYALLRLANPNRGGFTNTVQVVGIRPDEYSVVTNLQDGLYWQKPGPADQVSLEPLNVQSRKAQAEQARARGDRFAAQRIEEDMEHERRNLEHMANRRRQMVWTGRPDFAMAPGLHPSKPAVPLAELYPDLDEPTGIFVGIRVFYPTPDSQGRFRRQVLPPPGGERVQLTFMPIGATGHIVSDKPDMKEFFLVDTAFSQIPQIDRAIVYVPFDRLQSYLMMSASDEPVAVRERSTQADIGQFLAPARATRVLVKLADGVPLAAGRQAVQEAVDAWTRNRQEAFLAQPPEWQARSVHFEPFAVDLSSMMDVIVWEEANKDFYSAIAMQRSIAIVMVGIVSLTVIALIWVIFIMIVVEKTKDIGIVKSIGGSAGGVATIFIVWAAVLGAIGAALGGLIGGLFVRHMNAIERWLSSAASRITGTEVVIYDPRTYLFDSIPARFDWGEFLLIGGFAVAAAMVGALLPAWRAGRMNVVETLRYE